MRRLRLPSPTHPISFACFVPLFYFATKAMHLAPVDSILPVVAASGAGAALLFCLLFTVGRNADKSAMLTTIFVCIFYIFVLIEPFVELLGGNDGAKVLIVALSLLLVLSYIVVRTRKVLPE